MISGFDHVVIAVRDIAVGVWAYEALLGVRAEARDGDGGGVATAILRPPNLNVELMAPAGATEAANRLRVALEDGEGLKSLVFAARDLEALHRRAERVGLAPEAINAGDGHRSFRAARERTHGVRLFFLERASPIEARPAGDIVGIDHIVIRTADPERAAALYGARLGLDMRLDREVMGRRLMFFRCGGAVLEVVQDETLTRDVLWGLSWRVTDADAASARLAAAGRDVSDVRHGMKPGTRVFTVRDGTCGVPTLMIERSPRAAG